MRRLISLSCSLLGAGLLAAGCSSSPHAIDLGLCARFSACLGNWPFPGAEAGLNLSFGFLCEALAFGESLASRTGATDLALSQSQLACVGAAPTCAAVEACL
jgi:hypothetical protein